MTLGLFGDHWVSSSLEGAVHAPLHVLVVLLCSAYRAISCSLHFLGFSVWFIVHSISGAVCHYFVFQLHCLHSFLAVVGVVSIFSVHHFAGLCGEQAFLNMTLAGFFVLSMSQGHSTFKSLLSGLSVTSSLASSSSAAPVVVVVASSVSAMSLFREIAVAVAHSLKNSLLAIISAVCENTASVSSIPLVTASVNSGPAMVVACALAALSGMSRLPAFVSTFSSVPAIIASNSREWCGMRSTTWTWLSPVVCGQHPRFSQLLQTQSTGNSQPCGWFPVALLKWFFYLRSASLPSLLQQSAGMHPAVLQVRPPLHPDKLDGVLYLPVHLGYWAWPNYSTSLAPTRNKRERIIASLGTWAGKCFCTQRELKSLIGHLHHACKVTPQGRTFLHRMINLLCTFRHDNPGVPVGSNLVAWTIPKLGWPQFLPDVTLGPPAWLSRVIWCFGFSGLWGNLQYLVFLWRLVCGPRQRQHLPSVNHW